MVRSLKGMAAVTFAFAILLAAGSVVAADEPDLEQEAIEAAEAWLELIDAAKYDESWDNAAEYFKRVVKQEKWREMAAAARGPLGDVLSREVKATEYRTELPGAPDGEYVVIQFTTSFENKKSAVETVTPMRDRDGTWRVSGYFIR